LNPFGIADRYMKHADASPHSAHPLPWGPRQRDRPFSPSPCSPLLWILALPQARALMAVAAGGLSPHTTLAGCLRRGSALPCIMSGSRHRTRTRGSRRDPLTTAIRYALRVRRAASHPYTPTLGPPRGATAPYSGSRPVPPARGATPLPEGLHRPRRTEGDGTAASSTGLGPSQRATVGWGRSDVRSWLVAGRRRPRRAVPALRRAFRGLLRGAAGDGRCTWPGLQVGPPAASLARTPYLDEDGWKTAQHTAQHTHTQPSHGAPVDGGARLAPTEGV
jgi:hypothetical protein